MTCREVRPSVTLKQVPKSSGGGGVVFDLTKTFAALGKVWYRPLPSVVTPFVCVYTYGRARQEAGGDRHISDLHFNGFERNLCFV